MENDKINADLNTSIHNRFDIEVIDAQTGKLKQRAQAENVICNQLWSYLLTYKYQYFQYIHYGSGSGTPASTDTSLFTFIAGASCQEAIYDFNHDTGVASLRRKIQLSESTAVGQTLTEVGIAYTSSASSLCTHAMLKDMNGNQISIAKTDTDIINIYATIFVHFNLAGYDQGSLTMQWTPIGKQYSDSSSSNGINPILQFLMGMSTGTVAPTLFYCSQKYDTVSQSAYQVSANRVCNATDKTIKYTGVRINASSGNAPNGILKISFSLGGAYSSLTLRPKDGCGWFPGSEITGEAIATADGSTKDFSTKFGYLKTCKVFVDGVEQTGGVTIDYQVTATRSSNIFDELAFLDSNGLPVLMHSISYSNNNTLFFENPLYEAIGLTSLFTSSQLYASDDFSAWTLVGSGEYSGSIVNISTEHQHHRYWKLVSSSINGPSMKNVTTTYTTDTNLHFDSPPAAGSVITADYTTQVIAKDIDHVLDWSVTIQLGEYTA